jgi:predicted hotdog family 3-hydroxylacyl-ACP dehydratase
VNLAIENLLPHRAPMRWIEALTGCTETTAVATATFRAGDFAVADGAPLETALVECVAQTVAAALGQRAQTSGQPAKPGNGMLVAVSNFKIHARPPLAKTLRIEVRELKRLGLMLMISGTISCDAQIIATGELTLYA